MNAQSMIAANEATVRRFFHGTHTGDLAVIDSTVSPDIVTHGFPGGANPSDHESYKQFFRDFGASFSDMSYEITDLVASADRVAVRFHIEVRHTGAFAGVAPGGGWVSFDGMVLYRLENGLIAETWLHADLLSILTQIGAMGRAMAA
jgi:predicted ester cyclase